MAIAQILKATSEVKVQLKDGMQQMSKDVEEVKCMQSLTRLHTRIASAETESFAQGRRLNKTFTNGFLRRTRPQITTMPARPTKRERPSGSFETRSSRTGCWSVLSFGFMENVSFSYLFAAQNMTISELQNSGIREEHPLVCHFSTIEVNNWVS